jgi:hypothetical protein
VIDQEESFTPSVSQGTLVRLRLARAFFFRIIRTDEARRPLLLGAKIGRGTDDEEGNGGPVDTSRQARPQGLPQKALAETRVPKLPLLSMEKSLLKSVPQAALCRQPGTVLSRSLPRLK